MLLFASTHCIFYCQRCRFLHFLFIRLFCCVCAQRRDESRCHAVNVFPWQTYLILGNKPLAVCWNANWKFYILLETNAFLGCQTNKIAKPHRNIWLDDFKVAQCLHWTWLYCPFLRRKNVNYSDCTKTSALVTMCECISCMCISCFHHETGNYLKIAFVPPISVRNSIEKSHVALRRLRRLQTWKTSRTPNGCNKYRLMRDAKNIKMHYAYTAFNIRFVSWFGGFYFPCIRCAAVACVYMCSSSCSHWLINVNHIGTIHGFLHKFHKYSWIQIRAAKQRPTK